MKQLNILGTIDILNDESEIIKRDITMEENKVYNINFLNNDLPDKCANLIIADPPYFEVKGSFDFIWNSFDDYLKDVEKWAIECKRLLSDNGTLFWYGDAKKIAYSQIIFDKYFGLVSNITANIFDRQTNKIRVEDARGFISTTERILMYSNDVFNLSQCVFTAREYIREEIIKAKGSIIFKDVNKALGTATNGGGVASACLSLKKSNPAMLTKDMYIKLQDWLNDNQKEYEYLRKEYEDLRRPFNPTEEYKMDVLRVSQEGHITGKYNHETVKPEKLTRILIKTCSRKGDTLIIPFAGSGTECAMGIKEGLTVYGFDIEKKYCDMANKRLKQHQAQQTLF